ncbi:MAG: aspartate aminotransferase family protein [Egibacteraceae bacterium]
MDLKATDLTRVWHPFQQASVYNSRQLIVCSGEGPYIFDDEGRRYLDGISGLWNVCLGYSESRVTDAVYEQLNAMPFTSLIVFSHEPAVLLAERLAEIAPPGLDTVFFTSGGSEGIETALKLIRHVNVVRGCPCRQKVVSLHGAYHGMAYGALSVTGFGLDKAPFVLETPGAVQVPSLYTALLERREPSPQEAFDQVHRCIDILDPSTVGAVVVEPVMGVAGMLPHRREFLSALSDYCQDADIFLIFDEVATGLGRTGRMLAADLYGIRPDIIVLAKGITSGYAPLGAVLIDRHLFDICQDGSPEAGFMHGFTYGGHPASCAAALATIAVIESDGLLEKVTDDGSRLAQRLREALPAAATTPVRQTGLMLAFDLLDPAKGRFALPEMGAAVVAEARRRGVILRTTYGGFTFNLAPPFVCTSADLDLLAEVTADATKAVVASS